MKKYQKVVKFYVPYFRSQITNAHVALLKRKHSCHTHTTMLNHLVGDYYIR